MRNTNLISRYSGRGPKTGDESRLLSRDEMRGGRDRDPGPPAEDESRCIRVFVRHTEVDRCTREPSVSGPVACHIWKRYPERRLVDKE